MESLGRLVLRGKCKDIDLAGSKSNSGWSFALYECLKSQTNKAIQSSAQNSEPGKQVLERNKTLTLGIRRT
jgi:hypothetical protein